jgi:four helix bundle protein
MRDFRSLKAWQKAHEVALHVYKATQPFPREELYGLVSQLRRAASSVPANIAEGCGADSNREFARFLNIALRSASETEYHLLLARDLGYLDLKTHELLNEQVIEVKRMLTGLVERLNADH